MFGPISSHESVSSSFVLIIGNNSQDCKIVVRNRVILGNIIKGFERLKTKGRHVAVVQVVVCGLLAISVRQRGEFSSTSSARTSIALVLVVAAAQTVTNA